LVVQNLNKMDTKKKRKVRKIEAYTPRWEKEANNLARGYCPTIRPCKDCGHPVISGYCCDFCNSVNP
jgi:hypothetical protein